MLPGLLCVQPTYSASWFAECVQPSYRASWFAECMLGENCYFSGESMHACTTVEGIVAVHAVCNGGVT